MRELTRRGFMAVVGLSALTFAGCSKDEDETPDAKPTATDEPTEGAGAEESTSEEESAQDEETVSIRESGWFLTEGGETVYILTLHNNSATKSVLLTTVAVTGKDGGGSVLFEDSATIVDIGAGKDFTFGLVPLVTEVPETLEFSVSTSEAHWTEDSGKGNDAFSFGSVATMEDDLGIQHLVGEMTVNQVWDDVVVVNVTAALRDADGTIVGGGIAQGEPGTKVGESVPFDIPLFLVPDHDSIDLYAVPWA